MIIDQKQIQDKLQILIKALELISSQTSWQKHEDRGFEYDSYSYGYEVAKYYAAKTARQALKEFYQ